MSEHIDFSKFCHELSVFLNLKKDERADKLLHAVIREIMPRDRQASFPEQLVSGIGFGKGAEEEQFCSALRFVVLHSTGIDPELKKPELLRILKEQIQARRNAQRRHAG